MEASDGSLIVLLRPQAAAKNNVVKSDLIRPKFLLWEQLGLLQDFFRLVIPASSERSDEGGEERSIRDWKVEMR